MAPTLIVLGLLALGVGIVAWATRKRSGASTAPRHEQDVVWNDPVTPAGSPPQTPESAPAPASADDPFAHAPVSPEDRHP